MVIGRRLRETRERRQRRTHRETVQRARVAFPLARNRHSRFRRRGRGRLCVPIAFVASRRPGALVRFGVVIAVEQSNHLQLDDRLFQFLCNTKSIITSR